MNKFNIFYFFPSNTIPVYFSLIRYFNRISLKILSNVLKKKKKKEEVWSEMHHCQKNYLLALIITNYNVSLIIVNEILFIYHAVTFFVWENLSPLIDKLTYVYIILFTCLKKRRKEKNEWTNERKRKEKKRTKKRKTSSDRSNHGKQTISREIRGNRQYFLLIHAVCFLFEHPLSDFPQRYNPYLIASRLGTRR